MPRRDEGPSLDDLRRFGSESDTRLCPGCRAEVCTTRMPPQVLCLDHRRTLRPAKTWPCRKKPSGHCLHHIGDDVPGCSALLRFSDSISPITAFAKTCNSSNPCRWASSPAACTAAAPLHEGHVFGVRMGGEFEPQGRHRGGEPVVFAARHGAGIDDRLLAANAFVLPDGLPPQPSGQQLGESISSASDGWGLFVALVLEVVHGPGSTRHTHATGTTSYSAVTGAPPQIARILGVVVEIFVSQTAVVVSISNTPRPWRD